MTTATLLLAFSTGMLAAVNPCGFALLPAYLSYYLGLESRDADERPAALTALVRALGVSAAMTGGFVLVFAIIGAVWSTVQTVVADRLPWVMFGLGIALAGLGIAMVAGYTPLVRLPKLATSSGSQSAWSAFVFGVSYGVASLSCTMPLFAGTVIATFSRHDAITGIVNVVVFGVGLGAVITALTVSVSFARQGIAARLRQLLPHMSRISGVLLIVSGVVAAYYGWYEAQVLTGRNPDNAIGEAISGWQTSVSSWLQSVGEERIGIAVAIVVAAAVAISFVLRRGKGADAVGPEIGTDAPTSETVGP